MAQPIAERIYAVKNGVYSDFGPVQWKYMKNSTDGTKDGWVQVSYEQYKADTDPKKKEFVPPEMNHPAPGAAPASGTSTEFADVNGGGAAVGKPEPTIKEFVDALVKDKAGWGDITKQVNEKFKTDWKSWQALKAAYAGNKL